MHSFWGGILDMLELTFFLSTMRMWRACSCRISTQITGNYRDYLKQKKTRNVAILLECPLISNIIYIHFLPHAFNTMLMSILFSYETFYTATFLPTWLLKT